MNNPPRNRWINVAFASALAILLLIGYLSYRNTEAMIRSDIWEDHAYAIVHEYNRLISTLQDAETTQRGYIITGEEHYLEPYENALTEIPKRLSALKNLTEDNPRQQDHLKILQTLIEEKTALMKQGVDLRRTGGLESASRSMVPDKDQALMDEIANRVAEDKAMETKQLQSRAEEKAADVRHSVQTVVAGSGLSFLLLFIVFIALKKEIARRAVAERELLLHRAHLQERIDERTQELGRANALLQNEIMEHRETEQALCRTRDELELRIRERTSELAHAVSVLHDEVVQRSYTEQTLRERSDQLRLLASELTMAEQRERERLALVLHDGLQQILVGAKYWLALIERSGDVKGATAEVAHLIDDAIETCRSLTAEFSPPILRQGGLVPALEWLARWMLDKYGLAVKVISREPIDSPPEDVSVFLFQAVRELLFNVVKHAGVNAADIEIQCRNGHVQIMIADQGSGFDPAQLRTAGGTTGGFGLFSLQERLSHLRGQMVIDSSPGHGSRITLHAPLAIQAPSLLAEKREEEVNFAVSMGKAEVLPAGDMIRVLLVDDHMILRQGLSGLLRAQPDMQMVGEASNGQSALDLIRRIQPDIVLMDVGLPDMSGIEVTRIIQKDLPNVGVIGLSMFEEGEQAAAMRAAGAVDYVAKSGPSEAVIASIRASFAISKQKMRDVPDEHLLASSGQGRALLGQP